MKPLNFFLVACLFSNLVFADVELRGIEMILDGRNGEAPNVNSSKYIHKMIGTWVEGMHLTKLIQYEAPSLNKGAFHICVEPTQPAGYAVVYNDLNSFSPGSAARWDLIQVARCKSKPTKK